MPKVAKSNLEWVHALKHYAKTKQLLHGKHFRLKWCKEQKQLIDECPYRPKSAFLAGIQCKCHYHQEPTQGNTPVALTGPANGAARPGQAPSAGSAMGVVAAPQPREAVRAVPPRTAGPNRSPPRPRWAGGNRGWSNPHPGQAPPAVRRVQSTPIVRAVWQSPSGQAVRAVHPPAGTNAPPLVVGLIPSQVRRPQQSVERWLPPSVFMRIRLHQSLERVGHITDLGPRRSLAVVRQETHRP